MREILINRLRIDVSHYFVRGYVRALSTEEVEKSVAAGIEYKGREVLERTPPLRGRAAGNAGRFAVHAEERMDFTYRDIAKMIDHSLLNPVMTDEELEEGCRLAIRYEVAAVCIKPYYLRRASELLSATPVKPTTTVGFPHGGHTTTVKVAETKQALADGAEELDMVVNIGKVLSRDWKYVQADIAEVVKAGHDGGALVKVIFENCYLQNEHKIALCKICGEAGADFIKTSTGYGPGGATLEDLKLMCRHAPPGVQVKAAGGIRTLKALLEVRKLGVARVGASRTAEILEECKRRLRRGGLEGTL